MTGKAVPMTKVAIYGATGYTGFELIRLLLSHPRATIAALTSEQYSDQPVEQAFPPFRGMLPNVIFGKMEQIRALDVDAVFLALPHTVSASVAAEIPRAPLRKTRLAAVPGCSPTAVVLALYPLLKDRLIEAKGIVADCKTGVSGGGRGPSLGFHYPEAEGGVRPYGFPRHRHSPEMDQELSLAAGRNVTVTLLPPPRRRTYTEPTSGTAPPGSTRKAGP